MLALTAWREQHICPLCGMDKAVCQDPAIENKISVGLPIRCHVTTALRREQSARHAQYGTAGTHDDALLWSASIRP